MRKYLAKMAVFAVLAGASCASPFEGELGCPHGGNCNEGIIPLPEYPVDPPLIPNPDDPTPEYPEGPRSDWPDDWEKWQ
jgi:hypothetical protein